MSVRIGEITHAVRVMNVWRLGVNQTVCGELWVERTFTPWHVGSTSDAPVDCMSCLVNK